MKRVPLWSIVIIIILSIIILIKKFHIYEFFDSRPQVWYIWKSGNSISGRFSPYWTDLIKRIKSDKINVKICDVDILKEPDFANYEYKKKIYTQIPLVRVITPKGNRYDYNITDDYTYYFGGIGDMSGSIASQKIYKMILDKKDE